MPIVGLSQSQGFSLLTEVTSTRNLLAYGVRTLRTGAFLETTRDPILTMLSIGVEKLHKLAVGAIALDRDGKWPSKPEMKTFGHGIVALHESVMDELVTRAAVKSEHVQGLVTAVQFDPVVAPLLRALDVYGSQGRFYYLDALADNPQLVDPEDLWQEMEAAALLDPDVARLHQISLSDPADETAWNRFLSALNARIATSVDRVWAMISGCGINRAMGETGVVIGFEVAAGAVGRQ